jgi:1-acyl-sn-glycerol-3-phosphate acyltransferase
MMEATARHVVFDGATARPAPFRGVLSELFRWVCIAYLRLSGWRMRGDWPPYPKAVLVAAPHTSNWDGVNMLAAAGFYRVKLSWMGKKSLTTGPFGWLVKLLGCVPIDRSASNDVVATMSAALKNSRSMILAIPPEGTRSLVREWKTGFYHIALQADVPILLTVLDYGSKTISVKAALQPSGDYTSDLATILKHYEGARGRNAGQFATGA